MLCAPTLKRSPALLLIPNKQTDFDTCVIF